MSYGYSLDLRKKTLAFIERGNSISDACDTFGISRSTISLWIKKKRDTGTIDIDKRIKKSYKFKDEDLIFYVKQNPDSYLSEIAKHFNITAAGACVALKRLNITRKKRLSHIRKRI